MSIRVAVVGAGPAGVAAARVAAGAGASVTLIGAELPGGRANWHSLLPSKVFLTATDMLGVTDRLEALGIISPGAHQAHPQRLTERIRALSRDRSERTSSDLASRGVRFLQGKARFQDPHTVGVDGIDGSSLTVEADTIVLATGSVPIFPPKLKPNGKEILAPRFVGKLDVLPDSMIVIGGGVTGAEFAYAFNKLGVKVTWLVDEFGVLPSFDSEVVDVLLEELKLRGVVLHRGVAAVSATAVEGATVTLRDENVFRSETAFVAIGRRPDSSGLEIEACGLAVGQAGGIEIDEYCRSEVAHIYAAGDITGPPMCANKGMVQGFIAGLHAATGQSRAYRPETVIEAVYTDPQIAQVGLHESAAAEKGQSVRSLRVTYDSSLKAMLLGEREGFLKLLVDTKTGRIVGASAGGSHAADVLAPVATAIQLNATQEDLSTMFSAHPSLSELPFEAAREGD
ncbi:MAG: NAD(P)/FAD-dependent oxidoreductase [Acidobacteriota bacterium]